MWFMGRHPKYMHFKMAFSKVSELHSISTRHSVQSLFLPHVKSSGAKSFLFLASKMWNALPAHLESAPNGTTFKLGLRDHICIEMGRRENDIFIYLFMASFDIIYIIY